MMMGLDTDERLGIPLTLEDPTGIPRGSFRTALPDKQEFSV